MDTYLVPANSKKSLLILSTFNKLDLIVFLTGVGITIILLLIVPLGTLGAIISALAPLLIGTIAVLPLPQEYHNVMQFMINVFVYFTSNQRYYWKGWCIWDESDTFSTENKNI